MEGRAPKLELTLRVLGSRIPELLLLRLEKENSMGRLFRIVIPQFISNPR
jgi:hypothetical protein